MNGMSLIKHIRVELPNCKIIIITGHDEFAYAQAAIRMNVDDYILKPVNPVQLADVLTKITKQMASSMEKEEHLQMASKQIERNFSLLRERFCLEWMDGVLSEGEIREQLAFLKMPDRAPSDARRYSMVREFKRQRAFIGKRPSTVLVCRGEYR